MKRSTIIAILVLFLGICSVGNAHSAWGPCADIYTEHSKGGINGTVCGSGYLSKTFNNNISSIVVPSGFNMRLFKEGNLKGEFIDIKPGKWEADAEWDKVISSVQYNNWGEGCAKTYTGPNYTGKMNLICNTASLVPGYNDAISSMYVYPNHHFRLFKNADYTGEWLDVRANNYFKTWANQIKSMKLKHWSLCALLHQGKNAGGSYFMMCDTGVLPGYGTRQASSITVPTGMIITVYKSEDYTGESLVFKPGFYNLPDGWPKTIASAKVVITAKMDAM